jgi:hypothetical protein
MLWWSSKQTLSVGYLQGESCTGVKLLGISTQAEIFVHICACRLGQHLCELGAWDSWTRMSSSRYLHTVYLLPMALHPKLGLGLIFWCFLITHTHTDTSGLLWTSDQPVAETSTYTGQHNPKHKTQTSMPSAGFESAEVAIIRVNEYCEFWKPLHSTRLIAENNPG